MRCGPWSPSARTITRWPIYDRDDRQQGGFHPPADPACCRASVRSAAYHQVGLDDVLAEAELTKGAMYFHFRSKHALALAVVEDQATQASSGRGPANPEVLRTGNADRLLLPAGHPRHQR